MGDNYACEIKAVSVVASVKGRKDTYYYMAKCYPIAEARAQFLKDVRTQHDEFIPTI